MSGMKVKELMDSLKGDCYRMGVWTHNGSDFLRQTWAGLAAWGG